MSELSAARRAAVEVTSLHTGGCSACAQSLAALEAPRYARQLAALGVTFTRVPRHSTIILLCGALTEQARASASGLIAGTPHPRALVAVGDCAVNRCVFADSPCLSIPLAQAFHVNVEIGGCPPTPQAIIEAISEARRLLSDLPTKPDASPASDSAPHVTPTALSAPDLSGAGSAPGRSERLAALIAAAGEGWDADDDDDDGDETGQIDDELTDDPPPEQAMGKREHLTGTGNGASRPGARQHKEKH
jgi:Ni,Fe-hydrogenase III small subunit